MSKQPAIIVDNVSMKFNLSKEKVDSLKDYIIKSIKKEIKYNEFWALQNVSFTVAVLQHGRCHNRRKICRNKRAGSGWFNRNDHVSDHRFSYGTDSRFYSSDLTEIRCGKDG